MQYFFCSITYILFIIKTFNFKQNNNNITNFNIKLNYSILLSSLQNKTFNNNFIKILNNFNNPKLKECDIGYWGENCTYLCSDKTNYCEICEQQTGTCTQCIEGFHLDINNQCICGIHCLNENNCTEDSGCEECEKGYYDKFCSSLCSDKNEFCIECEKENGSCLACDESQAYLYDDKCFKCPPNCKGCRAENDCIDCINETLYGPACEYNCSHCLSNKYVKRVCDIFSGDCLNKTCAENFTGSRCDECIEGQWGYDDCSNLCSKNCKSDNCNITDGSCDCKIGYWGILCDKECDISCNPFTGCSKEGNCTECSIDYFFNETSKSCEKCPELCDGCSMHGCDNCIKGFYGDFCDKNCPNKCLDTICEKESGECKYCVKGYYNKNCSESCSGCEEGCLMDNGECINHICKDNYFDNIFCKYHCSPTCYKGCDLYTGNCTECLNNKKWGKNCEENCDEECKSNNNNYFSIAECCFVKSNYEFNSFNVVLDKKKNDNKEYVLLNLSIGEKKFLFQALVDFESNSELIIFAKDEEITFLNPNDESKIFISNNLYKVDNISKICDDLDYKTSKLFGIEMNGYSCKEKIYLNKLINTNINFIIVKNIISINENKFDYESEVQAIIGLGLLNKLSENLFNNKIIQKNIFIVSNNTNILFGDYSKNIKKDFHLLSSFYSFKPLDYNGPNKIKLNLTGLIFLQRKAYNYSKNNIIEINYNEDSEIIFSKKILQVFFEKLYFDTYFSKKYCYREENKNIEYFCTKKMKNKFVNLPNFGLIFDDYAYNLSPEILFKKINDDKYKFIISLSSGDNDDKVILGKDFLNEFDIVYNNGLKNIGIFGNVKNIKGIKLEKIPNFSDNKFSYSFWTIIIIFSMVFIVIIVYICKYIYCKNVEDEEDEEDEYNQINY